MKPAEVVQRNKFLIGVGVLVVAGIAAVIGVFLPAHRANAQLVTSLEDKAHSLEQYAAKTDLASKDAVTEATKATAQYQGALDELRAELEKQARPLAEPLKERNGPPNAGQLDGSTWKLVYSQDVTDLINSLDQSFLMVGANPVVAQSYGDEIPSAADVAKQTRYFLVQKYAIDALKGLNQPGNYIVPVFNGFSFLPAPERLLNPIHGQDFTPIPFEIRVSTEFASIPRVLYALLKSPVQFEITSISVTRPERLDRTIAQGDAWKLRTQPSASAKKVATGPTAPVPAAQAPGATSNTEYAGGPGLTPAQIQALVEEQRKMAEEQAKIMEAEMMKNMPAWMRPGGTMPGSTVPGGTGPTPATPRRATTTMTREATTVTETIKEQLPKTLVDLTIRGYVADYKKKTS